MIKQTPSFVYTIHQCTSHFAKELKHLFPQLSTEQLLNLKVVITFQKSMLINEKKTEESESQKHKCLERVLSSLK